MTTARSLKENATKIRFIEPSDAPYRRTLRNHFVYNESIRTPSQGIITLATIAATAGDDVLAYSECISEIPWDDVVDADIVCISIFTFSAPRGYEIADRLRATSNATVVIGGLHATLCPNEAARHAHYVMLGEGDETLPLLIDCIRRKAVPDFAGVAYYRNDNLANTGTATPPRSIDIVPDRRLLYRFKEATRYNTIWPQVHASRGCPHSCDYCALVAAFGRCVRTRSPESVVEDIRQAIAFFDEGNRRIARMLWITDDNFFADRAWALRVLRLIASEGISYNFTVQARFEVGFDDEMLEALSTAGFSELAMGIEFIEDEAFEINHKSSTVDEVKRSIANIRRHGLRVRGLFIVGADNHTPGVGERIARFVEENGIDGVLIQSMYFIPGTPSYAQHENRLIQPVDWSRCTGKVMHYPEHMSPRQLQREIIKASETIYSTRNLIRSIVSKRGMKRTLFIGEWCWQRFVRADLERDAKALPE